MDGFINSNLEIFLKSLFIFYLSKVKEEIIVDFYENGIAYNRLETNILGSEAKQERINLNEMGNTQFKVFFNTFIE